MEVYIEKDALDKLNQDFLSDNLSSGQQKLKNILHYYIDLTFYLNHPKEYFSIYINENLLFDIIMNKRSPKSCNSLKDFINSSNFQQTIVIDSFENISNRIEIEKKGGLYFTYENYSKKIEEILENYHKRIDLSDKFNGWNNIFKSNTLKLNEIIINDNYLLNNVKNIKDYILPLTRSLNVDREIKNIIFITDILSTKDGKLKTPIEAIDSIKKAFNNVDVIHNNFKNFSNHDRVLYTNFMMIDCPIGFNQVNKISNSIVIIETIFDKFTYDRRRRHLELIRNYIN